MTVSKEINYRESTIQKNIHWRALLTLKYNLNFKKTHPVNFRAGYAGESKLAIQIDPPLARMCILCLRVSACVFVCVCVCDLSFH